MPGVILAMLDHPAAATGLLQAAGCLSDLTDGARINVVAARTPPGSTILPSEEILTREAETRLRAQETARVATLKAAFDAWNAAVGGPGTTTEWFEQEALASDLIIARGKRADIIVMERPDRRDRGTTWQAMPAALFDTDRPVLVVPPGAPTRFGSRIAVAWRDDPHATRAVLSALRFAERASSVHLLAGMPAGAATPTIPKVLSEHGISVELRIIPIDGAPLGGALLAGAHAVGADLLVMGAYAHSPLREQMFGGVTRHVLEHADLPVLLRH